MQIMEIAFVAYEPQNKMRRNNVLFYPGNNNCASFKISCIRLYKMCIKSSGACVESKDARSYILNRGIGARDIDLKKVMEDEIVRPFWLKLQAAHVRPIPCVSSRCRGGVVRAQGC